MTVERSMRVWRSALFGVCGLFAASGGVAAQTVSANDVVLYASEAAVVQGSWVVEADATAAGGSKIRLPDLGVRTEPGLADPVHYFELTFNAEAGRAYRLWLRGKADGDSYLNDSVHVQFNQSVDSGGAAMYRIGTQDSARVVIEGCGGVGVSGWGWEDNGWCGPGVLVNFASSGTQTLRVQAREDGIALDQIVLSPDTYLSTAPGAQRNDTTILPKNHTEIVMYASDATLAGAWARESDATAAGGWKVRQADLGVKTDPALVAPTNYFELTFTATANTAYRLWIRGRADGDHYLNDSIHAQFDRSVDASGAAMYRIGTQDSAEVVIEGCNNGGLAGWGWEDNGWCALGPLVYFSTSGSQRIRLQSREDGLAVDQIVLSASRFLDTPPGPTTNDTTILARTTGGGTPTTTPPTITYFNISDTQPASARAPVTMHFMARASDAESACCTFLWEFGDGSTAGTPNAVHTYTQGGTYLVKLTVTDAQNEHSERTETVTVAAAKAVPPGSQAVRVLQWNIYKGRATDKEGCCEGADLELQARWMAGMGAEIIAMQEVMGGTGGQAEALAAKLATATRATWYYAHARHTTAASSSGTKTPDSPSPTNVGAEGVAILSRFPLDNMKATILDSLDPPYEPRAALGATVVVNGRTVAIISAHFSCCSAGSNDRPLEAEDLNAWVQTEFQEPRVILGDLNATRSTEEILEFTAPSSVDPDAGMFDDAWIKALRDASGSTASSYPDNPPNDDTWTHSTRIDYVFLSTASAILEVLGAQIPDIRDWTDIDPVRKMVSPSVENQAVRASDHAPVLIWLAVK